MEMDLKMNGDLKKRIMRRVYATWFWRSVAPLLAVEAILLAGVAIGILTHISLRNILINAFAASANLKAFFMFFVNNFFVKSIQSRLLVVAYLAVLFFFGRDIRNTLKRFKDASGDPLKLLKLGLG